MKARTSDQLVILNPATGERIGTAPVLDAAAVAELAARGRAAQPGWNALGFDGRAVILRRMQRWMSDHADELLALVQAETGRVFEDSVLELAYPLTALGHWARHSKKILRGKRVHGASPFVLGKKLRAHHVPHGLVGIIAPWNFPITIGFGDSIPALAAGNAVLLKPSEITPLSIEVIQQGLLDCGMPPDVFQVATGAADTGAAVVDVVDMVMFTGSTATGRKIGARAAERLIPVSLELGGKDPMIVLADANLERAANLAVFGANVNSGQVCLSTERFYVEAPVYDDFVARVVAKVGALRQGVPVAPGSVDVGAIITSSQIAIIDGQVRDAVAKGARILVGGEPATGGPGRFYRPTVLVDVDHSMACMTEETFGPLIPIMKVADADEAIRLANDSVYGLAATIVTRDRERERGERLARRIEAGSVSVNDMLTHCFALGLPMGGVKTSGIGTRHGEDGIRKFCRKQSILVARSFPDKDVHFYRRTPGSHRVCSRPSGCCTAPPAGSRTCGQRHGDIARGQENRNDRVRLRRRGDRSGFGGSVSALRLTEKGYRVGVLEAGRRFADDDFAATSWRLRRYLFAPAAGCYGILRMTLLKNTFMVSGAGVGGGSLVYANTLYRPHEDFFHARQWAHITDWKSELAPFYDQAERMLGVAEVPSNTAADDLLQEVATEMGRDSTFRRTRVGVYFCAPGQAPGTPVADPYFGGAGPSRNSCLNCGECIVGCRHNAKNTTVKNYLYLAEQAGATVHPLTTVTAVSPLPGGGYRIDTVRTGGKLRRTKRTYTADQVIFSAAALGTQKLLHKLKDTGRLPNISPKLGHLTRTNSEAVLYPRSLRTDADYSHSVAISSSFHPDDSTHIEQGRFGGKGSNFLALTTTVLVDPDEGRPRVLSGLRVLASNWRKLGRIHSPRRWSQQTLGLLAMQTADNSLITYTKRGLFGRKMTSKPGPGAKPPVWIPIAHEVARRVADKIDGVPKGAVFDLFDIPSTGHFLGGCPIGDSPETGVVDPYQRLYGYPGLHVVDGSAISANLGANPSLTITAQAERAMSFWPNNGDRDPRPALGDRYERLRPVAPKNPAVPEYAPGALRLPITPA